MLLKDKYFTLKAMDKADGSAVCDIAILPDCDVYRGHFPGHPVCPGVCNIETVAELASLATGHRLSIGRIKRCRFTTVATPETTPEMKVSLAFTPTETGYTVTATMADDKQQYMDFKGEMLMI